MTGSYNPYFLFHQNLIYAHDPQDSIVEIQAWTRIELLDRNLSPSIQPSVRQTGIEFWLKLDLEAKGRPETKPRLSHSIHTGYISRGFDITKCIKVVLKNAYFILITYKFQILEKTVDCRLWEMGAL